MPRPSSDTETATWTPSPAAAAHQAQELGTLPLQLLDRRQVLHGHHQRRDRAVRVMDRRRVDQRRDAAPAGHRELDLLGAHRLATFSLLTLDDETDEENSVVTVVIVPDAERYDVGEPSRGDIAQQAR